MIKSHDQTRGPFRAAQLRSGDPYEPDDGHPIECLPSGGRHAESNARGVLILETDPDVEAAGVDVGFTPDEHNLAHPRQLIPSLDLANGGARRQLSDRREACMLTAKALLR